MVSAANLLNESSNFQQKTHPGLVLSKLEARVLRTTRHNNKLFLRDLHFRAQHLSFLFLPFPLTRVGGLSHSLLHEGDEAHQLVVVWKPKGQDSKTIPSLLFEKA